MSDVRLCRIADAIIESKNISVLTGAGISTESGIPDFRSKKTGLWNLFDSNLLSKEFLYKNPQKFYELALQLIAGLRGARRIKPNKAHYILAQMEQKGIIRTLITQNIDDLHRLAGSKNIYEVHGNFKKAYCILCERQYSFLVLYKKIISGQIPPLCPACGGVLRTSIVLFGDELDHIFYKARNEAINSDLMLVIGSSLEVGPVNTLPFLAKKFIIINREPTRFDHQAFIVANENAGKALTKISGLLEKKYG